MPKLGDTTAYPITTPQLTDLIPLTRNGVVNNALYSNFSSSNNVFDVKSYGAKGDGVTDDSLAFQNTANAMVSGGTMYIPPGNYLLSAHTVIPFSNIVIQGSGIGATTISCGYDGSTGPENSNHGMFGFHDPLNVNPVNNCMVKGISFNFNSFSCDAIHWRGTTNGTTSYNFTVDNCEFYDRGPDNTGSTACVVAKGTYTNVSGSLEGLTIKNCIFRDAITTTSLKRTAYSIATFSDNLSEVRILNNRFRNTFGRTIVCGQNSSTPYQRRDWVLDGNSFYNTVGNETDNYFGTDLNDFVDSSRLGFNGIKITNNHFEYLPGSWTLDVNNNSKAQFHTIGLYQSFGVEIRGNTFKNGCVVMAPGFDTGSNLNYLSDNQHSKACIFSGNIVINYLELQDPDGNNGTNFSDNVFWGVKRGNLVGGYGHHSPSVYDSNVFVNCATNCRTDGAAEFYYGLFAIEDGGSVVQNNLIFKDPVFSVPSAPTAAAGLTGILNGSYIYKITFISVTGYESTGGTSSVTVSPSGQVVNLTNIPVGPAGTSGRMIYRTTVNGADGTQRFLQRIANNSTTTFTDNNADSALKPQTVPTSNATDSNQKYVFVELAGGQKSYKNIYKNNTIMGNYTYTSTFYLDDQFAHEITNNTGLIEAVIQSLTHGSTPTISALPASDIVFGNYQLNGRPIANAMYVPLATTTDKNALVPANGMIVYDTTLNKFQGYENGAWVNLV